MLNDSQLSQDGSTAPASHAEVSANGFAAVQKRSLAKLDASNIKVTRNPNPRHVPAPGSAEEKSQKVCSDHMVSALWTAEDGWARPKITPYGPLSLMPTANVLHYATECFEGMKLYRGFDGRLRLFRPLANCRRMVQSAQRISLPTFEPEELLNMIRKLCSIDGSKWLSPSRAGNFLYIRPALIGTDSCLGFEVPKEALLFVVLSYWPEPAKPALGIGLRLYASRADEARAWPGGTGYAKIGPNYGPALQTHGEARALGFQQVLWLYGPECQITEAGSSNVFVIWKTPERRLQLVTAPLDGKIILAGITRQSVLALVKKNFATTYETHVNGMGLQKVEGLEVVERVFTMNDLISAIDEGRLVSLFIVGTAAFVTSVGEINFRGQTIHIDADDKVHISLLRQWLRDIMYGGVQHEWAEIVEES